MLKKVNILGFLFSTLLTSLAFSGTMGEACYSTVNPILRCHSPGWELGAQALYLRPSFNNNVFISSINQNAIGTLPIFSNANYWIWGFLVEGALYFGKNFDVGIDWSHLTTKAATNYFASGPYFTPDLINVGIAPTAQTFGLNLVSSAQPKWDAVNLEAGQFFNLGEHFRLRYHLGGQYTHIKLNTSLIAADTNNQYGFPINFIGTTRSSMVFNGGGPRIKLDAALGWRNGLSFYGTAAGTALYGVKKYRAIFVTNLANFSPLNPNFIANTSLRGSSKNSAVGETEFKVGATYTYLAQGQWTLDIGWAWVNYYNVLLYPVLLTPGTNRTSNFSLQGPYTGFRWLGNLT